MLSLKGQLDISVIHGDGTTTAAKKGDDNLGLSGHKHMKGDVVKVEMSKFKRKTQKHQTRTRNIEKALEIITPEAA